MIELKKSNNKYINTFNDDIFTVSTNKKIDICSVFYDGNTKQTIIAVKLYNSKDKYDVDYIIFDERLSIIDVFTEYEGIIPSFVTAPDKSIWVRLTSTHTDKIREIVLPLKNRERITKENLLTEFVDHHSIHYENETFLFSKNIFNEKNPDKMCRLIFDKNAQFKSKKNYTIPLPSQVMPTISGNMLQLTNHIRPEKILHREMDFEGNITKERKFSLGVDYDFALPVALAFNDKSTFFVTRNNEMLHVEVEENGKNINLNSLFVIKNCKEGFYNVWEPLGVGIDAYVVKFNYDLGSGYAVVKNNKIRECWTCNNDSTVYQNAISGETVDLVSPHLTLTEIQVISALKYLLIFSSVNTDATDKQFKFRIATI